MTQLFLNNARAVLATSATATATSLSVTEAAGFPATLAAGDYFPMTVFKRTGVYGENVEIVRVTAISGTDPLTLTVVRGQEGTTAVMHEAKEAIEARLTAGMLNGLRTRVMLRGDPNVKWGTTSDFVITNFDSFASYTATAKTGSAQIIGDLVRYLAPGGGTSDTLTVAVDNNPQNYPVNLVAQSLQGIWTQKASGPTARARIHATAAAVVGDFYYLIGGNATADMWRYDLSRGIWQLWTPPPINWTNTNTVAAAFNGRIHVIGSLASQASGHLHQIYDPATDTWSTGAEPPTGHNDPGMTATGTGLALWGGTVEQKMSLYDAATDTWRQSATTGPVAGQSPSLGYIPSKNMVYVAGGYWANDYVKTIYSSREIRFYDIDKDTWTTGPYLAQSVYYAGGVVVDERFYLFGGAYKANSSSSGFRNEGQVYRHDINQWELMGKNGTTVNDGSAIATWKGRAYLFTGTFWEIL